MHSPQWFYMSLHGFIFGHTAGMPNKTAACEERWSCAFEEGAGAHC